MVPTYLVPHPDTPGPAIRIRVLVGRPNGGQLLVGHRITGAVDRLAWDRTNMAGRRDGLWQHGCFEAFIAAPEGGYVELNLAPEARWAAYRFDSYRVGMHDADAILHKQTWTVWGEPRSRVEMNSRWELVGDFSEAEWSLALAAVIEETDGTKSYWALAHAPGPPDFHNPACFTATLPPPASP